MARRSFVLWGTLGLLAFLSATPAVYAQRAAMPSLSVKSEELNREVATLRDAVEMVRRDQLNYRIEKDLLKEAFSSNLQTINLVLTLVLGVFAVLGYLGFKGISNIKTQYDAELAELRRLKGTLEAEIGKVTAEQEAVNENIGRLTKESEEQERRLKVLEIKEKVSQLIEAKKYSLALEFCDAGLAMDPENVNLLNGKGLCHMKFRQFSLADEALTKVLVIAPQNTAATTNLAELYLLTERLADFDTFAAVNKEALIKQRRGLLYDYFQLLRAVVRKDLTEAISIAKSKLLVLREGPMPRLGTWGFDEARWYVQQMPAGPLRTLAANVIFFLDGTKSTKELEAVLARLLPEEPQAA